VKLETKQLKNIIIKKAMVNSNNMTEEDLELIGMTRAEFEYSLKQEQRYIIAWSKTVNPNNL